MYFLLMQLSFAIADTDKSCHGRKIDAGTTVVLSSDDYRDISTSSSPCKISVESLAGTDLMVSISTTSSISLRHPVSSEELTIKDKEQVLVVRQEPKVYKLFSSPISVEIPSGLSFRAVIVVSVLTTCDLNTFQCGRRCDFSKGYNCSFACLQRSLLCDSVDSCGIDEAECHYPVIQTGWRLLSISQYSDIEPADASRIFCAQWIFHKDASAQQPMERSVSSENKREQRASILARINFEPPPILREFEPEVEDRSVEPPKEDICCLPAYQEYKRRQSLPAPRVTVCAGRPKWKRTSVAH
ncbi:unnamed protein product [Cylicocyclus nassatus]|uniref:Uncharacterized protein n=1 Tax=Cylicocyclus nassatus TaxID=53992 RepID=A0AA36DSA3_CYLNA|nr:unnamed protein product [Cylicocyclus nassatus]